MPDEDADKLVLFAPELAVEVAYSQHANETN